MTQLAKLAKRIPSTLIERTQGQAYAAHHVINQGLLGIVGPFDFQLVEILRGPVLSRVKSSEKPSFSDEHSKVILANVVVGGVFRLVCEVDGRSTIIEQTGDVEHPENWQHDGARLKDAESDALKRCAMRLGLGLHLWAQEHYVLDELLERREQSQDVQDSGDGGPGEEDPPELEAGRSGSVSNASSSASQNAGPQQQAQRRGSEEAQGVASKPAAAVPAALPGQAASPGRPSGRGTSAAVRAPSPAARVEAGPPASRAAGDLTARAPDDSVGSRAPAAGKPGVQPGVQPGGDGWFTAVVNELPGLVSEHDAALHLAGLPEFRDFFKGVEPGDRVAKLRRQPSSSAIAKAAVRLIEKEFAKKKPTPGTLEVGS